jgi:hypothetical protein
MPAWRALILAIAVIAAPTPLSGATQQAAELLAALEGTWRGRAVVTPVGPAPYDIVFRRRAGGCIAGTADNGFSHHTWVFCNAAGSLSLDFTSDFRGNTTPIHFHEVASDGTDLLFRAPSHDFMDLKLAVRGDTATAEVYHHGRLHVRIEWRRPARGEEAS